MFGLENPIHILFLLAVLLMVFGAKRLPEMGKGLGEGMRGFKDALSGHMSHAEITPAPAATVAPVTATAPAMTTTPVINAVSAAPAPAAGSLPSQAA